MTYPRILIDQEAVLTNAAALKKMGEQQRIQITPVVKALAGYDQLIRAIAELGFTRIGDSSLRHIRNYADLALSLIHICLCCILSNKAGLGCNRYYSESILQG